LALALAALWTRLASFCFWPFCLDFGDLSPMTDPRRDRRSLGPKAQPDRSGDRRFAGAPVPAR
jgi:hypothetical protein